MQLFQGAWASCQERRGQLIARVSPSLTEDVVGADKVLAEADRLGLDLKGVTDTLVIEGVKLFDDAFTALLKAVADKQLQLADAN